MDGCGIVAGYIAPRCGNRVVYPVATEVRGRQTLLSIERIARARAAGKEVWLSDNDGFRGHGRLVVRINSKGAARFYFRRSNQRNRSAVALGRYSKDAKEGFLTLSQARVMARRLSVACDGPVEPAPSLAQEPGSPRAEPLPHSADPPSPQVVTADVGSAGADGTTLLDLCLAYVDGLRSRNKQSWKNAQGTVARYVAKTEWAGIPARFVTAEQATALLRGIVGSGKGRTAGMVRSLLHAAYAQALTSKVDPAAGSSMIKFQIASNPISHVSSLSQFNKARQRSLNKTELGQFWRLIQPDPSGQSSISNRFLRLNLLLGGQRREQLLRVKVTQVDLEDNFIEMFDPKGRRAQARRHELPLMPRAHTEVAELVQVARDLGSEFLFPGRDPRSSLRSDYVSKYVTKLSQHLEHTSKVKPFQYSDLRRTTETLMTSLKVPQDVLARVLSHGLSGVQNRHYNRHEYKDEIIDALTRWESFLTSLEIEKADSGAVP